MLAQLRSWVPPHLPHEFFTPLAGIIGLMEILRGDFPTLTSAEVNDMHNHVYQSALRLHRTFRNFLLVLDLQTASSQPVPPFFSSREVEESIQGGVDQALRQYERREDVTVRLDACSISVKAGDLSRIIEELVDNACKFSLSLRVLPTLVDRLEAVAVGIENVRCIVAGIVIQARAGFAVINRAGVHRRLVERIHLGHALGDKADMCRPGVRLALSQPEENAAVSSEALEVGMSFGAILAVVVDGMHDTERLESCLVKGDRSIEVFDGYEDVVEQDSPHWLADII
jgi:hypothetical protein